MKKIILESIKKFIFNYTGFGAPNYSYNLEPIQLSEIILSIEKTKELKGSICEIGVARGMTSRFICEHLKSQNYDEEFYCIDTFTSFEKDDINFEIENRKKNEKELKGFDYNNFDQWKKNFKKFDFVKPVKADIKKFDFKSISPIKLVILDVDLYKPTIIALNNLKKNMVSGGIVIVDDIKNNHVWDGAYQAFNEFVNSNSYNYKIVGNKCGIINF
tara:strand:+ start:129 stop:776 length:648 start_codon:yes stop_codon:yes gene_type:complete